MMLITRKSIIKEHLARCIDRYYAEGVAACVEEVHIQILSYKVKFPLLEFCGISLFEALDIEEHIPFCDQVQSLKTEGGNVLLGIILQKRLTNHFEECIDKATEYIADADIWYVCDIIGERVFGYSLLHQPNKTIQEVKRLSTYPVNWVIRSLGAGTHYAIKKGLDYKNVVRLFEILLTMANTKDKEIRQGIGWAAKTTAKFHPDIIESYQREIMDEVNVANWFRRKIEIGLQRHDYAKRN